MGDVSGVGTTTTEADDTAGVVGAEHPLLDEKSDAWLVGRARELVAISQSGDNDRYPLMIGEVDALLAEAQRRGEPRMVGQLLRSAAVVRIQASSIPADLIPLLDELLAHTRRHGLIVLQADAHALRGRRLLAGGAGDAALTEAAVALAILDEDLAPDQAPDRRSSDEVLASTLMDIGLILAPLGIYETADQVMTRANRYIRASAGPHIISVHLINRIRMLLGWAMRLERIGAEDEAAEKFRTAAAIAVAVEPPFRESLYTRSRDVPAAEQMPVVAAAHALAHPSAEHVPRLRALVGYAHNPSEILVATIALARCHEAAGRFEQAAEALLDVRDRIGGTEEGNTEPTLRVTLIREFARLSGPNGGECTTSALEVYANELEMQLWDMRESRITMLGTRREHERLARRHGAVAKQALQDPLTGLPNRRALDERLRTLATSPSNHPLAVALVDLDGFKSVNDRMSHAEGDDVLRVVASTLRDAVRGSDMVARYGGDEFIVLLPGAPLPAAEAALSRATTKVERLPRDLSHGVTLSIGVVSMCPQETATQVLARADAAMYQAKRTGGNNVVAVSGECTEGTDGVSPAERA